MDFKHQQKKKNKARTGNREGLELALLPEVISESPENLPKHSEYIAAGTLYVPRDIMNTIEQVEKDEDENSRLVSEIRDMERLVGKEVVSRVLRSTVDQLRFIVDVENHPPTGIESRRYGGAVQGGSGQGSDSGREEGVQSLELWSERYSDHSNDSAYVLVDSKLNAAWPRGSILEADCHSSSKRGKSKRKNSGNRTEACFWADADNTIAPKSILKKVKAEEGNDTVEGAGQVQEELAAEAEPGDENSENLSVSRQDLVEDGLELRDGEGMSIGGIAPDIEEEPSSQAFPEQTQDEPQESQDMRSKQLGRPRVVAVQVQKFLEVTPKDRREHVRLTVSRSPDPPSGDVQKRLRFAINEDDRPSVEKPPEDPRPPGGQGTLSLDITVTTPRDRVTSRQSPPNNMKR